jgi:polysaccharide export outer membrane protein
MNNRICLFLFPLLFFSVLILAPAQDLDQQKPERQATQLADCTGPLASVTPDCQSQGEETEMDGTELDLQNSPGVEQTVRPPARDHQGVDLRPLPHSEIDGADVELQPSERERIPRMKGEEEQTRSSAWRTLQSQRRREPLSEFQKFVQSSTGQVLPIFGANLFEQAPSTFAPLNHVPVTSDYVIGPGDEILLRVWGQVTFNRRLTVDRSGAVYIPQVGSTNVAGLQFQQLEGFLHSQLSRVFRNFEMNVSMGQLRSIQVFVTGQARRPGTYTISSLSTIVPALFASGGPSPQGSMRRIQLKRGAQTIAEFDLYDLLLRGDKSNDLRLNQGDVIYIPPVGPQVAIVGSVKSPAIYELKSEHTVGELIHLACGLTAMAGTQQATLERVANHASLETLTLSLEGASLETPIQDGDILRILPVLPRFANTVTLRGNVANPGRFGWHPGMRLRDIIPDKASLVTRNYWEKHNLLGYISPLEESPADPAVEARRKPAETKIGSLAPEINWSYAVIERQNSRDLKDQLIPFNLGKLVLDGDESQNLPLEPGDVVTIFSQADFEVTVLQQTRYVSLEGEFNSAGVYGVKPGETLGQLIQRAGGLTPAAYLYGAQFLRKSVQREQQQRLDQFVAELERESQRTVSLRLANATPEETAALGAQKETQQQRLQQLRGLRATGRIVLNLEPGSNDISKLMNLQLEDGDRFIVPPRPATVNVIGAVYNPNAFLYEPGLRIRDYLEKSGGYTRSADKAHVYLIRANGDVVPRAGHDSLLGKAFDAGHLQPGDTIVVPEEILKTTFMKNMRDWSQVITGFGLGAAAVNVLR